MTKPAITKRGTKAAALTYSELDTNFQNIVDATVSVTAGSGGTQVTSDLNGNITLVAGTGITLAGNNTAKTVTITSTASGDLISDTSPQLGGDLDVNGFDITALTGQPITIAGVGTSGIYLSPDTGNVFIHGLKWPSTDGTANYVLKTDGAGNLSWVAGAGLTNPLTTNLNMGGNNITTSSTNITVTASSYIRLSTDTVQVGDGSGAAYIENLSTNSNLTLQNGGSYPSTVQIDPGSISTEGTVSLTARGYSTVPYGDINIQGRMFLTPFTTAQRDVFLTAFNGCIIYNSTTNKFQGRAGGAWVDLH
jgi:hypothetical protein